MSRRGSAGAASPIKTRTGEAMTLDRTSPIPLYVQVRNRLLAMVGGWSDPEERFYSDDELTAMFDVSRATVREALTELVEAGVLRRRRGHGTVVSLRKVAEKLGVGSHIGSQWDSGDMPVDTVLLAFERIAAPADAARALGVPAGTELLFVKRLRTTPIAPVSIDWRYLPLWAAEGIGRDQGTQPLINLIWRRIDLAHSDLTIEAALSGPEEMELLHLPAKSPILVRHLVYFDRQGRAAMAGKSIHRADLMRYSVRVDQSRDGVGVAHGRAMIRR
jgi:GntR family transcriptional regulator